MEQAVKRSSFEKRIHEIDLLRGLLMTLVILDHFLNIVASYNLGWAGGKTAIDAGTALEPFVTIYRLASLYWDSLFRQIFRWFALGSFCFVSGISSAFSRNNWKRAGQMVLFWALVFILTNILENIKDTAGLNLGIRTARVDFNIIGVLAWSTLIYCFVQDKQWQWLLAIAIIALALYPLFVFLSKTSWGQNTYVPFLWEPNRAIADQADYMPLFPYLGFFFVGALLARFTYSVNKKSYFNYYAWERPFCYIGRHSLIIYATHYIILIAIFSFVGLFI